MHCSQCLGWKHRNAHCSYVKLANQYGKKDFGGFCAVAITPNEMPRTSPLAAIQPSTLPVAGRSAPSSEASSRLRSADAAYGQSSNMDDQTASGQKQTPCLLPADNFGPFSLHNCWRITAVLVVIVLITCMWHVQNEQYYTQNVLVKITSSASKWKSKKAIEK